MKIYSKKPWQADEGQKSMEVTIEDVEQVRGFIRDIGGPAKPGAMVGKTADFLKKLFPHTGEPRKQWTERRLWDWWTGRSDLVRHWQMVEMFRAAELKKQERELLEAARREHAEFVAKTTNLRAFLERTDPAFHRDEIERLGQFARGVDMSRNSGGE